jgi:putative hemolysin
VFEFNDKSAGEVMTHRRDTLILHSAESDADWERNIIEGKHSFYPIFGNGPDDVRGLLCSREYLALKDRSRANVMASAVRSAQFVPLTVKTDVLFRRMKKSRNHFAVVVDEHGGTMGIVTMADLLEALVGDLEDDASAPLEEPPVVKAGPSAWRVSGAAPLERVARELGVELPVDDFDTFSGFALTALGYIPEDGATATVESNGLSIELLAIKDHRVEQALVKKEQT